MVEVSDSAELTSQHLRQVKFKVFIPMVLSGGGEGGAQVGGIAPSGACPPPSAARALPAPKGEPRQRWTGNSFFFASSSSGCENGTGRSSGYPMELDFADLESSLAKLIKM